MATDKIIMGWSKCKVEIGKTADDGSMATSLTSIGYIKDKSATLEPSDGDTLEMKATGGELVAKETTEGGYTLTATVIEPTTALLTMLGIGTADSTGGGFKVKTHIVDGDWSVQLTPKNTGAKGIKAPKCHITYKPAWSEEEGNYAEIEFEVLKGEADYWYSIFVKE